MSSENKMTKKEAIEQISLVEEMELLLKDYQELIQEMMTELEVSTTSND